jgi:hybrid cluster-associated redox disulfide protein
MTFNEVLKKYPETVEVFFNMGLSCVGCPMAFSETIEQGAMAHGIDVDDLVYALNKKVQSHRKSKKTKKK